MLELSPAEALGWIALLVFICGWFFILGVFVGRGLVPVPGEDEAFTEYLTASEKTPVAGPATKLEEESAPQVVEKSTAPPDREELKTEALVPPAADQPEKIPVIEKRVQAAGKEKPDDPGDKIFTIQVAALQEKELSDRFYEKLKKQGYAPYIVEVSLDGVPWYRIRCGRFANRDDADPVLEQLRKDGYSPILVR